MSIVYGIISFFLFAMRRLRDFLKQIQLFVFGLRSHYSTKISWSASVDAGGRKGRVILGPGSSLDSGTIIRGNNGIIKIGKNCTINAYTIILGGEKGVCIGNGVRIAPHCIIVASNHNFQSKDKFIYQQGFSSKGIVIEDDVWIGASAIILDGVKLRRGTVVAAGAVVTKSSEEFAILVGNPARKIKSREGE